MATDLDFTLVANNDCLINVTVTDAAGAAVNITGATIKWSLKRNKSTSAALTKTTSSGITITSGSGGIFQISIDAADTTSLLGDYVHDAVVTISGESVNLRDTNGRCGICKIVDQYTAQ